MKKINKFAGLKSTCVFAELISTQVDFTFAINSTKYITNLFFKFYSNSDIITICKSACIIKKWIKTT